MSARDEVVNLLKSVLPSTVNVMPYSKSVDAISSNTVMVRIDTVQPSDLPNILRSYNFALLVIVPTVAPETSDAALDDLLEIVLASLEGSSIPNSVVWKQASRATYEDKYPAYQVDISVQFTTGT